jgi:hypothetical protein
VTNVAVLPIRLGQKAAEQLSDAFFDLYTYIARCFVVDPQITLNAMRLTSVPVSSEVDFPRVALDISDYLVRSIASLAIIDLTNSTRPVLAPYSVVCGIVECCATVSKTLGQEVRLVFLLPSELWEEDPPMEIIRPLINRGAAWILTDRGRLIGKPPVLGITLEADHYVAADLPPNSHPAAVRVSGFCTPLGAGRATGDRRSWSGLRSRALVAVSVAA